MDLDPLAIGLVSTGLAGAQIFGWLALGSCFISAYSDEQVSIPLSLLMGAAVTAFVYAVFAAIAQVNTGIAIGLMTSTLSAVAWRQRAWRMVQYVAATYRDLWAGNAWVFALSAATLVLYWADAISPPRDADVLRYHLAHIRQMIMDHAWLPIPDYHYALPLGWSLNYLPFEKFGLPQAAHLLNLGLLIVAIGLIFEMLKQQAARNIALLLTAAMVYQPSVVKVATTAHADMYIIFVMLAITVLLVRFSNFSYRSYGLLGFAAWIGAQSRYQAIGIGVSVTVWLLLQVGRERLYRDYLLPYSVGSLAALALSSPFYIFNLVAFKNPVWPLMIPTINGVTTYADLVAATRTTAVTGPLTIDTLSAGVLGLLTEPTLFPIPIMALILLVVSLRWRIGPVPRLASLVAVFLVVWGLAQPSLYPRFSLMLVPFVIVGLAPMLALWTQAPVLRRVIHAGFLALVTTSIGVVVFYSLDNLRYAVTGDLAKFHRFTWFYDVYNWANHFTPKSARFLVVVNSGHSYYLDRPYRRADPLLSGVIDWLSLGSAEDLDRVLQTGGYEYVIYEDTDWRSFPGGGKMVSVIKEAIEKGLLIKTAVFYPRLSTLRVLRQSDPTTVWVLVRSRERDSLQSVHKPSAG